MLLNDIVPLRNPKEKLSLSCKCLCQQVAFKERFKVLKQLSGKIIWSIRRWYRYCSTCGIWLRARAWGLCQCCSRKLRRSTKSLTEIKKAADKRYRQRNKEKITIQHREWESRNKDKRKEYNRRYYLSKKK